MIHITGLPTELLLRILSLCSPQNLTILWPLQGTKQFAQLLTVCKTFYPIVQRILLSYRGIYLRHSNALDSTINLLCGFLEATPDRRRFIVNLHIEDRSSSDASTIEKLLNLCENLRILSITSPAVRFRLPLIKSLLHLSVEVRSSNGSKVPLLDIVPHLDRMDFLESLCVNSISLPNASGPKPIFSVDLIHLSLRCSLQISANIHSSFVSTTRLRSLEIDERYFGFEATNFCSFLDHVALKLVSLDLHLRSATSDSVRIIPAFPQLESLRVSCPIGSDPLITDFPVDYILPNLKLSTKLKHLTLCGPSLLLPTELSLLSISGLVISAPLPPPMDDGISQSHTITSIIVSNWISADTVRSLLLYLSPNLKILSVVASWSSVLAESLNLCTKLEAFQIRTSHYDYERIRAHNPDDSIPVFSPCPNFNKVKVVVLHTRDNVDFKQIVQYINSVPGDVYGPWKELRWLFVNRLKTKEKVLQLLAPNDSVDVGIVDTDLQKDTWNLIAKSAIS